MEVTERNRSRFSAPIPGFERRLRQAIAQRFPSVAQAGDALGLKHATLLTWLGPEGGGGGRSSPKHLDDLVVLSSGLGVSVDWLVFGRTYSARDWVETAGLGQRLKYSILERTTLHEFRVRLNLDRNLLYRWFTGRQRPDLYFLRHAAVVLDLSLDWLARGEPWEATQERHQRCPAEVAAVLAHRTLERMAARAVDPAVAHGLRLAARRASALPRPRLAENQLELKLPTDR